MPTLPSALRRDNPGWDSRLLTVKQVARRLQVGTRTIWRWVKTGTFPRPVRVTGLCLRWRPESIEAWLDELMDRRYTVAG